MIVSKTSVLYIDLKSLPDLNLTAIWRDILFFDQARAAHYWRTISGQKNPNIFSGCDLYGFGAIFFGCLDMLIHGSASISRYRSIVHNRGRKHINSIFRKKTLFPIKANEFFKFKVNRNQRNSMQSFWQWMCQWPSSLLRVRLKFGVWNVKLV